MKVGDLCNRDCISAGKDIDVVEAAMLMRKHHVGTLIVTEQDDQGEKPVGIITDRDIVIEIMAKDQDPHDFVLADVMTDNPFKANEDDNLHDTIESMQLEGIRRLPVVDKEGYLTGVLAVDDILGEMAVQMGGLVQLFKRELATEEMFRVTA